MFVAGFNDAIWKVLGICFMLSKIGHRLKTFLKALAFHKYNIQEGRRGMTTESIFLNPANL